MKFGITSLTLKQLPVETVAQVVSSAGLNGIEWGVGENHVILGDKNRADEILQASEKYGLSVFSLGSYCYLNDKEECALTVETAKLIKAPIIRVWAGRIGSATCDEENYASLVEHTRYMADLAAASGISLGFEFHRNSLTDTPESAVELIKKVDRENVRLYWQPTSRQSLEENLRSFDMVKPYLCGNIHFQNYSREKGYEPFAAAKDIIKAYFDDVKSEDWNVMIEFVKDSLPENVCADAATLIELLG